MVKHILGIPIFLLCMDSSIYVQGGSACNIGQDMLGQLEETVMNL